MKKVNIVVAEGQDVAGEAVVDFLGATIILEIFVIGEDVDNKLGTQQEVAPVLECMDDGEELAIPDWVVAFCLSEGGGVITHRVS